MELNEQEKDARDWLIRKLSLAPDSLTVEEWQLLYRVYAAIVEAIINYRTM